MTSMMKCQRDGCGAMTSERPVPIEIRHLGGARSGWIIMVTLCKKCKTVAGL